MVISADELLAAAHSRATVFAPRGQRGDVHVTSALLALGEYFVLKVATWFESEAERPADTDGYALCLEAFAPRPYCAGIVGTGRQAHLRR
jgi:hypothetical protein